MMRILVLVLMSLMVACGSNDDKKGSPAPGPGDQRVDTTDYTQCDRGAPVTNISGKWHQKAAQSGLQFLIEMEFHNNNAMTLTQTCSRDGLAVQAAVRVPAEITLNSILLLQEASNEKTGKFGDVTVNCRVDAFPGKLTYQIRGRCLHMQLENSSEKITLVRSR